MIRNAHLSAYGVQDIFKSRSFWMRGSAFVAQTYSYTMHMCLRSVPPRESDLGMIHGLVTSKSDRISAGSANQLEVHRRTTPTGSGQSAEKA